MALLAAEQETKCVCAALQLEVSRLTRLDLLYLLLSQLAQALHQNIAEFIVV